MVDFTGVKALTIPEGSVKKISASGVMLWEKPSSYKNLAEPLPNNTTDTSKWVNGYRFSSSGITAQSGSTLSNEISVTFGDVIRVKGVTLRSGADRWQFKKRLTTGAVSTMVAYFNANDVAGVITYLTYEGLGNGVYTWRVTSETYAHTPLSFRFAMPTPANANDVIITINQPIV